MNWSKIFFSGEMWVIDNFQDDNYSSFQLSSFTAYDYEISYNSNISLSLKSYRQRFINNFFNSKESFIIVNNHSIEKITIPTDNSIEILPRYDSWDQVEFITKDINKDIDIINKILSLIMNCNILIVINLSDEKSNDVEEEFRSKNKRFKEIKFNITSHKSTKFQLEISEFSTLKIFSDLGYYPYSTSNFQVPPPPIEYKLPISTTKPLF